jgi:hypothetical protein
VQGNQLAPTFTRAVPGEGGGGKPPFHLRPTRTHSSTLTHSLTHTPHPSSQGERTKKKVMNAQMCPQSSTYCPPTPTHTHTRTHSHLHALTLSLKYTL